MAGIRGASRSISAACSAAPERGHRRRGRGPGGPPSSTSAARTSHHSRPSSSARRAGTACPSRVPDGVAARPGPRAPPARRRSPGTSASRCPTARRRPRRAGPSRPRPRPAARVGAGGEREHVRRAAMALGGVDHLRRPPGRGDRERPGCRGRPATRPTPRRCSARASRPAARSRAAASSAANRELPMPDQPPRRPRERPQRDVRDRLGLRVEDRRQLVGAGEDVLEERLGRGPTGARLTPARPCVQQPAHPSRGAHSHDRQHRRGVHELVGLLGDLEGVEQVEVERDRCAGPPQAVRVRRRGTGPAPARSTPRCRGRAARSDRRSAAPPGAARSAPRGPATGAARRRRAAASRAGGAPRSAGWARPRSRSRGSRRPTIRTWPRWRSAWIRITSGAVATASNRETRAAIADASRRSSAPACGSTAVTRRDREVELPVGLQPPGLELVVGRRTRGEVRRPPPVASRAPRAARRPASRGPRRPPSPTPSTRCPGAATRSARNSAVRSYASSASATNAWSIATVATPAVAGDDLRPAGEPRHARERRLLREVGGQLQVRVQARAGCGGTP